MVEVSIMCKGAHCPKRDDCVLYREYLAYYIASYRLGVEPLFVHGFECSRRGYNLFAAYEDIKRFAKPSETLNSLSPNENGN